MAHEAVRGFILREIPLGDADRLVEILTADRGLITAVAKGARRAKSPLVATTLVFSFVQFQLFAYKGRYSIDSAELIESFTGLRENLDRLVCAAHLSEVFLDLLRDSMPDENLYALWAYTCHQLKSAQDPFLIIHIAQFRALSESGFAPLLSYCQICGKGAKDQNYFNLTSRSWICSNDFRPELKQDHLALSGATIACLNYCLSCPIEKLFAFRLDPAVREEICQFSALYLQTIMEKSYQRLNILSDL